MKSILAPEQPLLAPRAWQNPKAFPCKQACQQALPPSCTQPAVPSHGCVLTAARCSHTAAGAGSNLCALHTGTFLNLSKVRKQLLFPPSAHLKEETCLSPGRGKFKMRRSSIPSAEQLPGELGLQNQHHHPCITTLKPAQPQHWGYQTPAVGGRQTQGARLTASPYSAP